MRKKEKGKETILKEAIIRAADAPLVSSRERCYALSEIEPVLFIVDSQLRVLWCSEAAMECFALAPDSLCVDVFPGGAGARFAELCANCFQAEKRSEALVSVMSDSCVVQSVFNVIFVPVVSAGGVVEELFVATRDISEKYVLESKLQQAWKMGALIAGARRDAHDFNNHLTPVLGYCEMLRLQLNRLGVTDPTLFSFLDEIQSSARSAKDRVDSLLVSLYPPGRERTQRVQPVLYDVLAFLQACSFAQVDIVAEISEEVGEALFDYEQLRQVVVQLCLNGLEAVTKNIDEKGRLDVVLRKEYKGSDAWVIFAVADNGCGISLENQQRLFAPEFTTKESEKGAGLGLALVEASVRSFGGEIAVESVVGQGSVFTVKLPAC